MEFFCSLIVKKVTLIIREFDPNHSPETQMRSHYWADCKNQKAVE